MEKWKTVKGYSMYKVSDKGRVKSIDRYRPWKHHGRNGAMKIKGKMLKAVNTSVGYLQVGLSKNGKSKSVHIHRLVAATFLPKPKNATQVNHKDGNKKNNNLQNLEWCNSSENGLHSYRALGNKAWHKGKQGKNTPTSKPILQKTLNGKVVKRWDCGLDAVRDGGFESSCISRCASGKQKNHKGYRWEYDS